MNPQDQFKFCPKCAAAAPPSGRPLFECGQCGFQYYFNPGCAAGAFVTDEAGKLLFIQRAREPAKGKWAVPGGFIDFNESAEEGLRRELREEVGLEMGPMTYLCSHPNEYFYKEVTYRPLDLFFMAPAAGPTKLCAPDEIQTITWLEPDKVRMEDIAFASMRFAMGKFLKLVAQSQF
jgi:ADP-ribose pyrophosphatase YjhB (NUDIX family)